jgi:thiamine transport system substrate-binding protein
VHLSRSSNPSRRAARRHLAVAAALAALVGAGLSSCTDDDAAGPVTTGDDGTTETSSIEEVSCAPDDLPDAIDADEAAGADVDGTTVTLVTHGSFAVSDGLFDDFTAETGITVEQIESDDAGTLVSQAVLSAGNPVADVLFGIDTTFLCRGTSEGVFVPYASPGLADVPDEYRLDPDDLVTPIDVGDVCLNYSMTGLDDDAVPTGLDDLTDDALADQFVTPNPETSSPGFAFLLATIATHGDDWEQYWTDLRANGVEVTSGWDDAYYGSFDAGAGDRTVVTSYATSPVADVVYADPPRDEPAIGVVADACFRQVEFAGILRGTEHPEAAALLVDFMLSPAFQEDIPLNMFVEPVSTAAELPEEFEQHRTEVADPLTLTPGQIEAGRDQWTDRWTEIVLR